MIIWGSRGKTTEVGTGQFFCPRCQCLRKYVRKDVGRYFTLYFIPLFKTSTVAEYIECQVCLTPFETKVLDLDPAAAAAIQALLSNITGLIEKGLPIHAVYKQLIDDGASKDAANTIISMATGGKMKTCKACELIYADNLKYCSNCGGALVSL